MFLIDYIIIFITSFSVFFGVLRGFFKEIISDFFWLLNFYFFYNYYYFNSFYLNKLEKIDFKSITSIMVLFFF